MGLCLLLVGLGSRARACRGLVLGGRWFRRWVWVGRVVLGLVWELLVWGLGLFRRRCRRWVGRFRRRRRWVGRFLLIRLRCSLVRVLRSLARSLVRVRFRLSRCRVRFRRRVRFRLFRRRVRWVGLVVVRCRWRRERGWIRWGSLLGWMGRG